MDAAFAAFHTVIRDRIDSPGAVYYPDPWWQKEIDILSSNVDDTIQFIQRDCTDEEMHWLGEIFDELIEETQSLNLLKCLHERAERIQDEHLREEALEDVQNAAAYLSAK